MAQSAALLRLVLLATVRPPHALAPDSSGPPYPHPPAHIRPQALVAHKFGVTCVAFSPDGTTLASGSEDKMVSHTA